MFKQIERKIEKALGRPLTLESRDDLITALMEVMDEAADKFGELSDKVNEAKVEEPETDVDIVPPFIPTPRERAVIDAAEPAAKLKEPEPKRKRPLKRKR